MKVHSKDDGRSCTCGAREPGQCNAITVRAVDRQG